MHPLKSCNTQSRYKGLLQVESWLAGNVCTEVGGDPSPAQLQPFNARGSVRGSTLHLALAPRPQLHLLAPQLGHFPCHLQNRSQPSDFCDMQTLPDESLCWEDCQIDIPSHCCTLYAGLMWPKSKYGQLQQCM